MIINTKEISSRIKFLTMILMLACSALIVLSMVFSWSKNHILEYSTIAAFILYLIYISIKKYYYIYYNTDGLKIIIRYTSLSFLSAGNYSIEIPKRDFIKAEIKKSFSGLRKELVVYVNTPQGIAKFKPISLATLKKEEINKMMADFSYIA
jgi:hypothetical protein